MATEHDLLFYENKTTPKVVGRGESFNAPKMYGKLVSRQKATPEQEKIIAKGDGTWIRVDVHGNKPGDPGYKKSKLPGREHLYHSDPVSDFVQQAEVGFTNTGEFS